MRISIITATYNSSATVADTLRSVDSQTYKDIEHVIVDGLSKDSTLEIVSAHRTPRRKVVSEIDSGLYDAMNKGIALATGEVVGILNSDDYYADPTVIETVMHEFAEKNVDAVFADLIYVSPGDSSKVVRYYDSSGFSPPLFAYGWMPAHPTFFVKKTCYERFGLYKTDYTIAADYELLVRLLWKHRISYSHIPKVIIKMRTGGVSTKNLKSNWILNREIVRACSENGLETNLLKVYSKYFKKLLQVVRRPK